MVSSDGKRHKRGTVYFGCFDPDCKAGTFVDFVEFYEKKYKKQEKMRNVVKRRKGSILEKWHGDTQGLSSAEPLDLTIDEGEKVSQSPDR
jgi:hypothetical protein